MGDNSTSVVEETFPPIPQQQPEAYATRKHHYPSNHSPSASNQASTQGPLNGPPLKKRRCHWNEKMQAMFLATIFDVGLKHSTATSIRSKMNIGNHQLVEALLRRYRVARRIHSDTVSIIAQRQMDIASASDDLVRKFRPRLRARHRELCDALHLAATGPLETTKQRNYDDDVPPTLPSPPPYTAVVQQQRSTDSVDAAADVLVDFQRDRIALPPPPPRRQQHQITASFAPMFDIGTPFNQPPSAPPPRSHPQQQHHHHHRNFL